MLHLQSSTSSAWVEQAVANIDTVLLDHAHCEKKAAAPAINLIFRYPHYTEILRPLSELAREELEHFELVLDHLDERNKTFQRLAPSAYAGQLLKQIRQTEPHRLVDMLLCCSLIEARSCERMGLLADALGDVEPKLAKLYAGLLKSEARHHMIYVKLALNFDDEKQVFKRLKDLSLIEADLLSDVSSVPRMHN